MDKFKKLIKENVVSFGITSVSVAFILILDFFGFFQSLELKVLDFAFSVRGPTSGWIAPEDINDILIIADVIDSSELVDKLENIKNAANEVRSARHQASMHLHKMMHIKLPTVLENKSFDSDLLTFELEGFGEIIILRVEEIDTEKNRVNRYQVNKLFKGH